MVAIELINTKAEWDAVAANPERTSPSNILQSWAWGDFQEALGRKVWRIGVYKVNGDKKELMGLALAQLVPTKFRTHIYISNGPIMNIEKDMESFEQLLGYLKALAIQEGAKFVRLDPLVENNRENRNILKSYGLKTAATHTQAERKWLLDIDKTEDELFAGMKKNRRYEIRRAIKDGTKVHSSTEVEDFAKFDEIFWDTVSRQKFVPHMRSYYTKQFEIIVKQGNYKVYWVEHNKQVVAAALISFYGDTAAYLHAASIKNKEVNKLYAPQSIIWQAILDGKKEGIKNFDFWGLGPTDDPKDPTIGYTNFKKSFGGREFKSIRGHDLPTHPSYPIVRMLESTREIWGHFYYRLYKR